MSDDFTAHGVRLRAFRAADIDDLTAACADPVIQQGIPSMPSPYTRQRAQEFIDDSAPASWGATRAVFAVVDPVTDRLLGSGGLGPIQPDRRAAEIGYWVAPWARGEGIGNAAAQALRDYGFQQLGLRRLELLTMIPNVASQRVAIAAGFQREGVRRQAIAGRDDTGHDAIAWARLATDPPGPSPRLLPDLPGGQLTDGVVTLRPIRPSDTDTLLELRSLPEVVDSSVPPVPPTRESVSDRATGSAASWLAGERAELLIVDTATGSAVGDLGLYFHEPRTGSAMVGYAMLPRWRGHGYVTRALRLLAPWAFGVGIARLVAGTQPSNIASQRALERAGFQQEGYARDRLPGPDNTRVDDLTYALLPGKPMRAAS